MESHVPLLTQGRPRHRSSGLVALLVLSLLAVTLITPVPPALAAELHVRGVTYAATAGTTTLSLAVPTAGVENDQLVAVVTTSSPRSGSGPAGWELQRVDSVGEQLFQGIWTKRAEAHEPSSYTWPVAMWRRPQAGVMYAVAGSHGDDLQLTVAHASATGSDPLVIPSTSAGAGGALALGVFALDGQGTFTVPDEMTIAVAERARLSISSAHQRLPAGPTGDYRVTRDTSGAAIGQLLLIEDPVASTDPTGESDDPEGETDPGQDGEGGDAEPDPGSGHGHDLPDPDADPDGADTNAVRWSDPHAWPTGQVPTAADDVVVDGHVLIDGVVEARTVKVPSGSTLEFVPDSSGRLEAHGNVVIEGTLVMRPSSHQVTHVLQFVGVDESTFVGGGHQVLDTDTGLWFTGDGHAMLRGSERLPWTRAATSLTRGSTTVELEDVPDGWQVGDLIIVTPTGAPGTPGHFNGYSQGRIASIDGATVTLDVPLAHAHPRVNGQWGAEVMNMTRNVRIEGTPGGRAHVMFAHTHRAQHLQNVALRHMGPRQPDGSFTKGVMGRYPLHFHHNGAGSAGSVVENVVVQQSGHRAFVPHASDGITFTGTIAHDVFDEAYWWDRRDTSGGLGHKAVWERPSNDISYVRAIASNVKADPSFRGFRLAGFELGHGNNLSITGSVAVGVQGNHSASGFSWPEGVAKESGDPTIGDHWHFADNVGHNNKVHGIFTWQNTDDPRHVIQDSVLYHNGVGGIDHGAYSNAYRYQDLVLFANGRAGTILHAQGPTSFHRTVHDGGGITPFGFATAPKHNAVQPGAELREPVLRGYTNRAIAFFAKEAVHLDIIHPDFGGPERTWFHLADHVPAHSRIRVQLVDGRAFRVHPASSPTGTLVPEWNARMEAIAPFTS
jgi:hypothetical protein